MFPFDIYRIDRHYAPNVSLVPEPYLELREKFHDEEDELDLDDEPSHIEGSCRGRKSTFSSTSASEMTKSASEEDDDFSDTDSICSGKCELNLLQVKNEMNLCFLCY